MHNERDLMYMFPFCWYGIWRRWWLNFANSTYGARNTLFCHWRLLVFLTFSGILCFPLPPLLWTLGADSSGVGGLQSKDIFLTGLFPHLVNTSIVSPSSCPSFEALHLSSCLPIHLSACTTGFMTQMLQQWEGWNICGAFLFRPCGPKLQRTSGTDYRRVRRWK